MNKLELVFNIYKDEIIKNKEFRRKIKEKYGFSDIVISNLIVRIVNYQIKKYGSRKSNDVEIYTREELRRKSLNARTRKGARIHHWEKAQRDSERVGKKWKNKRELKRIEKNTKIE